MEAICSSETSVDFQRMIGLFSLMLFREAIAVYYETHTKHIYTLCGQTAEFLNIKAGGTYNNHCA
jgi:hypothetical protein